MTENDFEGRSLPQEQWERMQKDLNEDMQASAKSKPAHLNKDQQHELLANIMKYGDDWKMVT